MMPLSSVSMVAALEGGTTRSISSAYLRMILLSIKA